ncbi:MAG: uracil-DNA glycosylase [Corynebacterium sp.]|uniref:uracil-DNA glycosylase n=1 Tax=Corynebacterium sp. TaxID=1720 RepID=UPI0026DD26F6|nr:uracil-DNA glycosylase [Corynebacterium sp.]MDO4762359.1 uracil-DNA glycosylase [Corynebacterium sp.]
MSYFDQLPIHPTWKEALTPVADTINQVGEFLERETGLVLPPEEDRWRAFSQPVSHTKVLIVGQDPYPTPGHAMGLSFSLHPSVSPLARSVVNIFTELTEDIGCDRPETGDLRGWADQGVMLLNRVLSVRGGAGQAGSHRGCGWESITEHAINVLAQRNQPIVAILWGKDAQKVAPLIEANPQSLVLCSAHPSPLSARRGFFGSRPFSQANAFLRGYGVEPISWAQANKAG